MAGVDLVIMGIWPARMGFRILKYGLNNQNRGIDQESWGYHGDMDGYNYI